MAKKILVAMSGGLDSTFVAHLLKQQGYYVEGITMITWDFQKYNQENDKKINFVEEAQEVAERIGIKHHILDVRKQFDEKVIKYFEREYLKGNTPNPCVHCNPRFKWGEILDKAITMGFDFIATGHYVKIAQKNERFIIQKGEDLFKDQSYFLWDLSQYQIQKTIFPLGNYKKEQVREEVKKLGFDNIVKKGESFEICFIPKDEYRDFLKDRFPLLEKNLKGGNFQLSDGTIVGQHQGYPFYTIGQRKGLKIALGEPMYVTNIDARTNTVTIGKKEELYRKEMILKQVNIMAFENLNQPFEANVKIRYRSKEEKATVYPLEKANKAKVIFRKPIIGITPGQSAVFFQKDLMLGGGIIL